MAPGTRASIDSARSAVMKSPGTNSPVSSMKKQRSASPSHAMPRSARCSRTFPITNCRFSSRSGFGWWLGNVPSGSMQNEIGSIGSFGKTGASIVPAIPFAPSRTTRSGDTLSMSISDSTFSPNASSTSRRPRTPCRVDSAAAPESASVLISSRPESLPTGSAPRVTIFMPLYSAGLCEAVTVKPPS